jgi:hypothetical protein
MLDYKELSGSPAAQYACAVERPFLHEARRCLSSETQIFGDILSYLTAINSGKELFL